ncbi:NUDIX hydrolase [Pseudobacillus sp. FSL P4-0506]|uniref:NUDIX hydrolase n=1 Tax=Pseudobacillus sp. FSL P4-0506 TaxID=2921576 RepID=UPI0030FAAF31
MVEETAAHVDVGPLALIYEFAPHKQSGDYHLNEQHALHLIFECSIKNNSLARLSKYPDPHQSAVKWISLEELDSILLIPNISQEINDYHENKRSINLIEDHSLGRLRLELN